MVWGQSQHGDGSIKVPCPWELAPVPDEYAVPGINGRPRIVVQCVRVGAAGHSDGATCSDFDVPGVSHVGLDTICGRFRFGVRQVVMASWISATK